ncbi:EF-hand domain-containing protein [Paracidovorax sp. MALMAid1276]
MHPRTGRAPTARWVLLGGALALASAAAVAQAPAGGGAHPSAAQAPGTPPAVASGEPGLTKGEIKAQREFKMLDFNSDGKLSRAEVKLFPRLAAAFDDADTDGDGYVSYEEVRAFAAKYRAERDRQKAEQAAEGTGSTGRSGNASVGAAPAASRQ